MSTIAISGKYERSFCARKARVRKQSAILGWSLSAALLAVFFSDIRNTVDAQPTMLDPNLSVRTLVSGLVTPTSMAFIGDNDILVLEKNTGRVQRVMDGVIAGPVLDLAVNFGSELGLLGIALHPDFPTNPVVYLYWTESTTGADTSILANVPLLGNRVDRFVWDGTTATLTFDQNIIRLRAFQLDENQPLRGNHDGGVLRFGPDGKLYIIIGDVGRRGWLQNNLMGPVPDDQFGGPEPDNAHLTGVILRLNDDGSSPEDNPFFEAGAEIGGEVGANIQKIFSYGHRNSFGMAFDPLSSELWIQENADDAFSEINRIEPGMNGGWVQIMGRVDRIAEYKFIETTMFGGSLQQLRWPPTLIADTPEEALSRLFMLPGSHYSDPEFSWKFEVAPAGIGFLNSQALGPDYEGNLFVGAGTTNLVGGYLFRFKLTEDRRDIAVEDPRLEDRVADNLTKHEITESESLLIGRDFGIGSHIQTGPNGNLLVISLTHGAIYEIFRTEDLTTLSVSPDSIPAGGTVDATWSGIATPTPTDWIGLYVPGTDDAAFLAWRYTTGDASGSVPFEIPGELAPGTYVLRLFANDGFMRLAESNPFTVTAGLTTLSVSPDSIPAGGTVDATWSGIPSPTPEDWIGLYLQGTDDFQFIDWFYVSCSQIPGSAQADGSCPFVVPANLTPGTYDMRLFSNNGFTRLATSNELTVIGNE